MHNHKRRRNMNWNRILQWIIIALIISVIVSKFNLWAFWWIPFLFILFRKCSWKSHSRHERRHKHHHYDEEDDVDYV